MICVCETLSASVSEGYKWVYLCVIDAVYYVCAITPPLDWAKSSLHGSRANSITWQAWANGQLECCKPHLDQVREAGQAAEIKGFECVAAVMDGHCREVIARRKQNRSKKAGLELAINK